MRNLSHLLRNTRAAAAVEFALISPILLGLVAATLNIGVYFFAQNSVSNALDTAARETPLYPRPSKSTLTTAFDNALLKAEVAGTVSLVIDEGISSSGLDYYDMSATYNVPIDLIFVKAGSYPVSASRRVYLPV